MNCLPLRKRADKLLTYKLPTATLHITETTRNRANITCITFHLRAFTWYLYWYLYCFVSDLPSPIESPPIPQKHCFCLWHETHLHLKELALSKTIYFVAHWTCFLFTYWWPQCSTQIQSVYLYSHCLNGLSGNQITTKWYVISKKRISNLWNPRMHVL